MKDLFFHYNGYGAELSCSVTGKEWASKEMSLDLKSFYLILWSKKSNNISAINLHNGF